MLKQVNKRECSIATSRYAHTHCYCKLHARGIYAVKCEHGQSPEFD